MRCRVRLHLCWQRPRPRCRQGRIGTKSYRSLVTVLSDVCADSAVIGGEIVALDPSGRPNFQALQNSRTATLAFYV